MNGVLGQDSALIRLYWVGDNPGSHLKFQNTLHTTATISEPNMLHITKHLVGKLTPELAYFVLKKELQNCSETGLWCDIVVDTCYI